MDLEVFHSSERWIFATAELLHGLPHLPPRPSLRHGRIHGDNSLLTSISELEYRWGVFPVAKHDARASSQLMSKLPSDEATAISEDVIARNDIRNVLYQDSIVGLVCHVGWRQGRYVKYPRRVVHRDPIAEQILKRSQILCGHDHD